MKTDCSLSHLHVTKERRLIFFAGEILRYQNRTVERVHHRTGLSPCHQERSDRRLDVSSWHKCHVYLGVILVGMGSQELDTADRLQVWRRHANRGSRAQNADSRLTKGHTEECEVVG